ncbi:iron(III)-transport ATP-binding protein [Parvularcula bermudensis HTCC2503]|uniref:Iron(III)-transport ATP-binding protein n=1 Tax=Parvularcula bermudensis (strain ATCC BAA-594 / HTCC2503 / KCTC 12087) TaxID=314260 RepID=E0THF3_PARBH|nr:ABC transporter ATP-binding protein [Parvularcula bermudensis]ADM10745.1 iron(III)-transport ATP-binding protein [Parvularcula bermudensis HTCC2503]
MALEFHDVGYSYGTAPILTGVTLTAAAGQVTCLLGASGSGKTTLLRLAAGVLAMQSGRLCLDGDILATGRSSPPPERRPIGLLFQEGALFPHMTVAENIVYGLDPRGDHGSIVAELLEQVGLPGFARRYPHTLSGGQQQRVALARALAPNPRVLLMDEPFASIDMVLRRSLRETVREVLAQRDCVALLVTHDPLEAMMMSDHIAVMEAGRIVQADTPDRLYDAPATLGVARMIGGGTELEGMCVGGLIRTAFGDWSVRSEKVTDGPVRVIVREAPMELRATEEGGAIVTDRRTLGLDVILTLKAPGGERLRVLHPRVKSVPVGDRVLAMPETRAVHLFPPESDLISD